jgi:uronate dehydrogenase
MKTILLTGAAGRIGTALRKSLKNYYYFRCVAHKSMKFADDIVVADIIDFDAIRQAMHGVDAVIHLAANSRIDQPWQDVYTSSIGGTYNVFEAARQVGIKKIIYASSSYVSSWQEVKQKKPVTPDMPVSPDTLYGVGKLFGETLGRYFAEKYNMSIICLRIGAFYVIPPPPKHSDDPILSTWCSANDLAQLVQKTLDTDNLGFQIFYGVSNNTRRLWDISNAEQLIGYKPQDDAERFLKLRKTNN